MVYGFDVFRDGKWAEIIEDPVYQYQWLKEDKTVSKRFYSNEEKLDMFIKPIKETKRLRK